LLASSIRVVGASAVQSRLEVAGAPGLTPIVGREHEVGLLWERWTQNQAGLGQVVLLSGEAGIGKSRLVQMMKPHVAVRRRHRILLSGVARGLLHRPLHRVSANDGARG
jgi:hypothetical protein